MAFSHAHRFDHVDFHFSMICDALSHPARIAIIRKLHRKEKMTAAAIYAGLPLSKPSVSQHLRILREMHIVKCEQVFPTVYYWLNTDLHRTHAAIVDLVTRSGRYLADLRSSETNSIRRWRGEAHSAGASDITAS